jgi:hypothetical protein
VQLVSAGVVVGEVLLVSPVVTVIEPTLAPVVVSPVLTSGVDGGDLLTFEVLVSHDGASDGDANNVEVFDGSLVGGGGGTLRAD